MKVSERDQYEIKRFIEYLKKSELRDGNLIFESMRTSLQNASKKIPISFYIYKIFLKIKKPKLIMIHNAHYFGDFSLLLAAKSLNIKTIEYQHGYIGLAHPAYNYHENMFVDVKEYLPDYFLTHGDYWSSVARTPAKKVSIGLPNLTKKISQVVKINKVKKNIILFISGGTVYKDLNQLIENNLTSLIDLGYEVLLRPHPLEINRLQERYSNLINQGVKIDDSTLYKTLQEVEVIVGMEVSTVLYEAVCFCDKVYIMNTKYTRFYEPKSAFISFNPNELVKKIQDAETLEYDPEYFWSHNWKQNYSEFISNILDKNE
jgi:hypothetical protein